MAAEYSIEQSAAAIAEKVANGDLEYGLREIRNIVGRIITEPLCAAQVFGSRKLDTLCAEIGRVNFETLNKAALVQQDRETNVFIATKLQRSGGHTRVMFDMIRSFPATLSNIVLLTELEGRSEDCLDLLADSSNVQLIRAPRGDLRETLGWLQTQIIQYAPQKIFLLNHHNDSVAVAAIQPRMKCDAYFVHHADHHLCLGVFQPHLKHIDLLPHWYHNCRDNLGIDNAYVPLSAPDKGVKAGQKFMERGYLTTCTAARSNKVKHPYLVSYIDLIPTLLQSTDGVHIHIGHLNPIDIFRIKRRLKKSGIANDRFVYMPWVQSIWTSLQEMTVDLYIDSFPFSGGKTVIEALGAGIPVVFHKHFAIEQLTSFALAPPGAFFWRHPKELIEYCRGLTPALLQELSQSARAQYQRNHSPEIFNQALKPPGTVVPPEADKVEFTAESDEWNYYIERQISLRRVIKREAYRWFRRLRSALR